MREILNGVVQAEKLAQANVIRRREEANATRSLLNTAKLVESSPVLMRLKELEALEKVTEKIGKLTRSEEHTSELQSLMRNSYAVFCLKQKTPKRQGNTSIK